VLFRSIGQLITLGTDRALEVQYQAQGILLCQAKMAEVVAGAVPLANPVSDAQFDEDPNWMWSLQADQDSSTSLLWTVNVTVSRQRPDGSKIRASLSQKVIDPSQRGSATDAAVTASSSGSNSAAASSNGSANSQMPASTSASGTAGASGSRGATSSTPSSSNLIQPSSSTKSATQSSSGSGAAKTTGSGAGKTTSGTKTGTSGTGGK